MRRFAVCCVAVAVVSCGEPSSSYLGYGLGPVEVEAPPDEPAGDVEDAGVPDAGTEAPDAGVPVSFAHDIAPILGAKCRSCHTFTYPTLLNGVRVVPFMPTGSSVYTRTLSGSMPRGGTRLTNVQQQLLFDWISQGALNN